MKAGLPFNHHNAKKNDKFYVVFDFKDDAGKRKKKWVATELSVGCSDKALKAKTKEIVAKFYEEFLSGRVTKVEEKVEESL